MKRYRNYGSFMLSMSVVVFLLNSLCNGAITGPKTSLGAIRLSGEESGAPIRLADGGERGGSRAYNNRKMQTSQRPNPHQQTYSKEKKSVHLQQQRNLHSDGQQSHQHQSQTVEKREKNTNAKLKIIEPPMDSIIAGSNFQVSVEILAENEEDFTEAYEGSIDGKICISLDESPYHCGWPAIGGRIFFSHAIEGSHTIEAILHKDGKLLNESKTETISFTTVENPDIVTEDMDSSSSSEKHTSSQKVKNQSGEIVNVKVPIVQVKTPADKVTYPGSSVEFHNFVDPPEPELFEKYFRHTYICVNIDAATAHSCFAAFGDSSRPFVIGLDPGLHSIEAVLSHPESGDLLFQTSSGTKIFYSAGDSNEAAYIVGEADVDGGKRYIPVAKDGSLSAQADEFCSSIGLSEDISCTGSVFHHLSKAWRKKDLSSSHADV